MAPTRRLYATRLGRVLLVLGISLLFFSRDFFLVCARAPIKALLLTEISPIIMAEEFSAPWKARILRIKISMTESNLRLYFRFVPPDKFLSKTCVQVCPHSIFFYAKAGLLRQ